MSILAMEAVFSRPDLEPYERLVMLALADHADDAGTSCYPSIARLCDRTGMKERGVQTVIKRLAARGLLRVEAGGGRRNCNQYTLLNPAPDAPIEQSKPRTGNPAPDAETPHPTTETPHPTTLNPAPDAPEPSLTVIEPSEEKNPPTPPGGAVAVRAPKVSAAELEAEFERVWPHYPRRVGKGAALAKWITARRRASYAEIAEPLKVFIKVQRGAPIDKIPHFATWLHNRRWEDEQAHAVNRPRTSTEDLEHLSAQPPKSPSADLEALFANPLLLRRPE